MTAQVDFYVLAGSESRARLKFACRLAEKACLAEQRVFVWCDEGSELQSFDELLWTFADRSFVPHEMFVDAGQWRETPVLLGCQTQPQENFDMLLNLGTEVPASASHAQRIVEIVDALEARRVAGRNRFRHYRNLGLAPETHNIVAEESP
ncbi:MAG TPA: DNA polymerase III subunit chi [Steroidobacteraceae bacterium]